jgi:protein SOK2
VFASFLKKGYLLSVYIVRQKEKQIVFLSFPSRITFIIEALLHAPTSKLELPSLASVQTRAPADVLSTWSGYNPHYAKGGMSADKLPSALSFSQSTPNPPSEPRGLSSSYPKKETTSTLQVLPLPSATQGGGGTQYSPSANQFAYSNESTGYMNTQSNSSYGAIDYGHPHHMSQGQPPTPQTATSGGGGLGSFPQPPLLQPTYPQSHGFPHFSFSSPNGVSSPAGQPGVPGPMGGHPSQQLLPLPQSTGMTAPSPLMSASQGGSQAPQSATAAGGYPPAHTFDATGQVAPPGMKPRVAATLWEDEGSLCFQVEARGVCVARREGRSFC